MSESETLRAYRERFPAGPASVATPPGEAGLPKRIRAAVNETTDLAARARQASAAATAAKHAIADARALDAKTAADQLRGGGKETPPVATLKAEHEHQQLQRRAETLERAALDAHQDLLRLLGSEREKLAAEMQSRAAELIEQAQRIVDELGSTLDQWSAVRSAVAWLADPHRWPTQQHPAQSALGEVRQALAVSAQPERPAAGAADETRRSFALSIRRTVRARELVDEEDMGQSAAWERARQEIQDSRPAA